MSCKYSSPIASTTAKQTKTTISCPVSRISTITPPRTTSLAGGEGATLSSKPLSKMNRPGFGGMGGTKNNTVRTVTPASLGLPSKTPPGTTTASRASPSTPTSRAPPAKPDARALTSRPPIAGRAPPGARSSVGMGSTLVPCRTCQRSFAPERIQAHSEICAKTNRKKRKPFDSAKHRVMGTELEPFQRKGRPTQPPPSLVKSNWRRKHQDFIANIRAAKQAQTHVAKGGKLSDLPPPPPMDTSDLIPCPHCNRKFNDAAAERHIPKCATMLHNKPKPTATATKTRAGDTRRF